MRSRKNETKDHGTSSDFPSSNGKHHSQEGSNAPVSGAEFTRVRKKRKSHKARNRILIILGVLVLVFAALGGALALYLNSLNQAMSFDDPKEAEKLEEVLEEPTNESEPFYMLVLGSDARAADAGSRTDVMILLRVDAQNGVITMVSIPRDTMIEIEGYGTQKINAAYAYGGTAGAVSAVSKFAGVPISRCAVIHFDELEQLVDDLGGVWVDVPVSNNETGASNTGQQINSGYQLLNGKQALAFARERYGYSRGDFQRADNQKLVAQAIIKQVLDQQPTQLPSTIQKLAECVTVNYSVSDIVALAQQFQKTGVVFYTATVPSTTATIDGVSYTITIQDKWNEMMELVKQGKDPSVLNDTTMGGGQAVNDTESSGPAAGTNVGVAAGSSTVNSTEGTAE